MADGSAQFDFWQLVIAALAGIGGGSAALWRSAIMIGKAEGRIEELERQVNRHDQLLLALIDKGDMRHEANLREFRLVGERIAGLPDVITQRVEEMLDRRRA